MKAVTAILLFASIFLKCQAFLGQSTKTQCYENLGCYSNEAPFNDLPMPKDPETVAPQFYFKRGPSTPITRINSSLELEMKELVIAIHGWNGGWNTNDDSLQNIMHKLAEIKPEADHVFVDWEKGAANGFGLNLYTQAASNTRLIGAMVRQFFEANPKFDPSKTHCIGFSLGSHVCGFFSKSLTSGKLARITALDPASPNFDKPDPRARVDSSDADYVDAVHTSWCGLQTPVGHVDFWVNDANRQPGCLARRRRGAVGTIDISKDFFGCSHFRALYLYAETISPPPNCSFKFCPCASQTYFNRGKCNTCDDAVAQEVGYWSFKRSTRGSFYGKTTGEAPYCIRGH